MEPEAAAPAPEATPAEPIVEATPAVTEGVEPVVTEAVEPVVETPPAVVDPYEEFGGRERIEAAHRLYEASSTEDGVIQLFLESGRSLGLGLKEMQALFESLGGVGDVPEPPDPDEPMTRGEWQAAMEAERQAQAAREAEAQTNAARATVQRALTALSLDVKDPATQAILTHGDKYLNGDLSEANVLNAIRRGQADYEVEIEKQARAYLAKKAAAQQNVPSAPAGAGPAAEPPAEEPKNVAEAIKAVRKRLSLGS